MYVCMCMHVKGRASICKKEGGNAIWFIYISVGQSSETRIQFRNFNQRNDFKLLTDDNLEKSEVNHVFILLKAPTWRIELETLEPDS